MKNLFFAISLFVFGQPLFAKDRLPAAILTLKNDTLRGEIKVPNGFAKGRGRSQADVQYSIDFYDVNGQKTEFTPDQIAGFLIWTADSVFEKFVPAQLGLSKDELFEKEQFFGKMGLEARFASPEKLAFVHVLHESGGLQLFDFYGESVLNYTNGGLPGPTYNSLVQSFLVKKGDGIFLKLSEKEKKRRKQIAALTADCEKVRGILEKQKLNVMDENILKSVVASYSSFCK